MIHPKQSFVATSVMFGAVLSFLSLLSMLTLPGCSSSAPSAGSVESPGTADLGTVSALPSTTSANTVSPNCNTGAPDPAENSRLRWPTLKRRDSSQRVLVMQHLLVAAAVPVETDGKFGGDTENAVKNFQGKTALAQTGTVNSADWLALVNVCDFYSNAHAITALQVALSLPGYARLNSGEFDEQTKANWLKSRVDSGSAVTGDVMPGDWLTLVGVGD
jgi:Putative peptidoglycan binding domain